MYPAYLHAWVQCMERQGIYFIIIFIFYAAFMMFKMTTILNFCFNIHRVLQSIALENVIPAIGILGKGRGPNKVPLYAMGN